MTFARGLSLAAIGSDVAQDVRPPGYGGQLTMPIHTVGIVAMGLRLIDNCNLEDVGVACAELKRWEFQFVLGPLRMEGGRARPPTRLRSSDGATAGRRSTGALDSVGRVPLR